MFTVHELLYFVCIVLFSSVTFSPACFVSFAMQPVEYLNLAWSKPKLKHKAPNVLGLTERFNQ